MNKTNFEIISKEYRSNCMIEAIKEKMKNKKVKIYFCKPRITENGNFQMFHFMWSDGKYDYDFSNTNDEKMPWYKVLYFNGYIRKFELGFAKEYTRYRNGG